MNPPEQDEFQWTPDLWRRWTEQDSSLVQDHLQMQEAAVSRWIEVQRPESLLEAGCGYGRLTKLLANRFPQTRVTAVDDSPAMLKSAAKDIVAENVSFCLATLWSLPFASECFDAVACIGVIMHVEREVDALHEMVRVLRPGGTLLVTYQNLLNPFSVPYRIYSAIRKPSGYLQTFRTSRFLRRHLGFGMIATEKHPDLLVPELRWPRVLRPLTKIMNRGTARLGYEPILVFLRQMRSCRSEKYSEFKKVDKKP